MRRPVTLADVARLAGVSVATASRALNRPEMLLATTVERTRRAAHDLGYVGNPAARALATGLTQSIAVVLPDIANPFFPPLLRAAQAEADTLGFTVLLGDADESAERERGLISKLGPQVDGILLASPRMTDDEIGGLARTLRLVVVNRDVAGVPRVLVDVQHGMAEAVAHLASLGHRHILYLSGPTGTWSERVRQAHLRSSAAAGELDVTVVPAGRPSYEAGRDAVGPVLASGATAAITFDDVIAHGLLGGFALRGVDVPRDFSVIGCDDILAATTHPPLTTISAGAATAGSLAATVLLEGIARRSTPDATEPHRVGTRLVVRATTGPAPRPG